MVPHNLLHNITIVIKEFEDNYFSNIEFICWRAGALFVLVFALLGFPGGLVVKNLPAKQETRVWSLGQEDPLEEGRLPTPVFMPGESHGQTSLTGYSPWGHKGLDTTEQLSSSLLLYHHDKVIAMLFMAWSMDDQRVLI